MSRRAARRAASLLLAALALGSLPARAGAQTTVAEWNPQGNVDESNFPATSVAPGIAAGAMTHVGLTSQSTGNSYAVEGYALALDPARYVEFSVTGEVHYSAVQVSWYSAGSGAGNVTVMQVRSSVDGYASALDTASHPGSGLVTRTLDVTALGTRSGTVTFRLYCGGASSFGLLYLDGTGLGGFGLRVVGGSPAPGVTVSAISGDTTEAGGTATFTVVLDTQPTAAVTIPLGSTDLSEGTVPASVGFTTGDWSTPKTVVVTGVDDFVDDGDQTFTVQLGPATSADPGYDGMDPGDVAVTNLDDDTAGVTVSAISGSTTEAGGTATFTVVLDSEPTADVSIPLASSDPSEGTVPASVDFTPGDWSTPKTVVVTGVDDPVVDGPQVRTIVLEPAASADPGYAGIDPRDVAFTNEDDDTGTVTVDRPSVSEGGDGQTVDVRFTLTLDATVIGGVVLSYGTQDGTAQAGSDYLATGGTLTLAGEPGEQRTVAVSVLGDSVEEADETFLLQVQVVSPAVGVSVAPGGGVATVLDDDGVAGTAREPVVGDVTGDGILDLVVSATRADLDVDGDGTVDVQDAGIVYVWAGATVPAGAPTATLAIPGARDGDRLGDAAGQGVQLADVTGDGILDVVVGARFSDETAPDGGAVYVWAGGASLSGTPPPRAVLRVTGAFAGDRLGDAAGQGVQLADVTGDGITDVVAAASAADAAAPDAGAICVWAGGAALSGALDPHAVLTIPGASAGDRLGDASGQGVRLVDVTGDGVLDVVGAASAADVGGVVDAGAVFVWSGGTTISVAPVAVLAAPAPVAGDRLGEAGGLGVRFRDVTGDGFLDVVVAARHADVAGVADAGAVLVWAGGSPLAGQPAPLATCAAAAPRAGDQLGSGGVRFADVDGDGVLDLVVAAPLADTAAELDAGAVLVWSGMTLGPGATPLAELRSSAPRDADHLGETVRLGDVTGDGIADVVVAVPRADPGAVLDAGAVVVWAGGAGLAGAPAPDAVLIAPAAAADDRLASGGLELVDVTGDGVRDLVAVSPRADVSGRADAGAVFVWTGGPALLVSPVVHALTAPEPLPSDGLGADGVAFADVTGDGVVDLVVATGGAGLDLDADAVADVDEAGAVHVWSGGNLAAPPVVLRMAAPAAGDRLGSAGIVLADVTGDGRPDVIAAAPEATLGGAARAGAALVWDAATLAPPRMLVAPAPAAGDSLCAGGPPILADVTGDGRVDLFALAPLADADAPPRADVGLGFLWTAPGAPPRIAHVPDAWPGDRLGS